MKEEVIYITTDTITKRKLKVIGKKEGRTEKRQGEYIIKKYIEEYESANGVIEV